MASKKLGPIESNGGRGAARKTLDQVREIAACSADPLYFIDEYCQIYEAFKEGGQWIPFRLWDQQIDVLTAIQDNRLVIVLKARQLGLSWLCLAYALWLMLFYPQATILIFSKTERDAIYLLGGERLRGMFQRLPDFLKDYAGGEASVDAASTWGLRNGSVARCFATTGGDSYTATLAIIDEADLIPHLQTMMGAVKPTIDGGGRLVLISRIEKKHPQSVFKQLYRGAKEGKNPFKPIFLPWDVRPGRDAAWYEEQRQYSMSSSGALDWLYEQYPATEIEALAPASLDKRIPYAWLQACYQEKEPLTVDDLLSLAQHGVSIMVPEAVQLYPPD